MARSPTGDLGESVPTSFPETTPRGYAQPGHDFTLQAVMEIQRTLGEMSSKLDRVVTDVKSHGEKLDTIRSQISFVRGVLWVLGALLAIAIAGITAYLRLLPK
jgi:hypothetical protein